MAGVLPDGWTEHVDPESGNTFYANESTGETAWDRPVSPKKKAPPAPPPKPTPNPKPLKKSSSKEVAPKVYVGDPNDSEKRRKVLEEILLTEASYNHDLHTVVSVYIEPIQANNVLTRDEFKDIFADWLSLVTLSDMLYSDLQEAVQAGKPMSLVFSKVAPFMKTYAPYLKGYQNSMATKTHLTENHPLFGDFLSAASQDPRCHGLDLGSFLIMPVQRVPRYKLLLEALLHETPETHADYNQLKTAIAKVSEVAKSNNDLMAQSKTFDILLAIQLKFDSSSKLNLLDIPTRTLIKEGVMDKQSRKGLQSRNFWLFNDKLIYGFEAVPRSGTFQLSQDIDLKQCVVQDVDDVNDELSFQIYTQKKSFTVTCKNKQEYQEWRSEIEKALQAIQSNSGEAVKLAPRWVPDSASPACMVCGESFGLGRRRHHCRACGDAVCSACSGSKKILPHIDPLKAQRVCQPCFSTDEPLDGQAEGRSITSMNFGSGASMAGGMKSRYTLKSGAGGSSMSLSLNSTNSFPNSPMASLNGTPSTSSSFRSDSSRTTSSGFGSTLLSVALGRKTEAVVIDEVNPDIFLDILADRCPEFAAMRNGYQTQALISSVLHPALEKRLRANGGLGLVPQTNPPSYRPPPPYLTKQQYQAQSQNMFSNASIASGPKTSPTTPSFNSASSSAVIGTVAKKSPPPPPPGKKKTPPPPPPGKIKK